MQSRGAMFTALAFTRVHNPSSHVVGYVIPPNPPSASSGGDVSRGRKGAVIVPSIKGGGKIFATMGRGLSGRERDELLRVCGVSVCERDAGGGGAVELLPEEALYLLESGRLDVRMPSSVALLEGDDGDGEGVGELPMSLQAGYATFLSDDLGGERDTGVSLERYVVYAGLRRSGFVVRRAKGFSGRARRQRRATGRCGGQRDECEGDVLETAGLSAWLYRRVLRPGLDRSWRGETEIERRGRMREGPLVSVGLYRSYSTSLSTSYANHDKLTKTDDVYNLLSLRPAQRERPNNDQSEEQVDGELKQEGEEEGEVQTPFTTTYLVHKPSQGHYRKSAPPPPNFRVCVIDARTTRLPTLPQLMLLLYEEDAAPSHFPLEKSISKTGTDAKDETPQETSDRQHPGAQKNVDGPRNVRQTYAALKRDKRLDGQSVLLGVVDTGVVSFMRVAEAGFAEEGRLFDRFDGILARGGGRGGRRGGRTG